MAKTSLADISIPLLPLPKPVPEETATFFLSVDLNVNPNGQVALIVEPVNLEKLLGAEFSHFLKSHPLKITQFNASDLLLLKEIWEVEKSRLRRNGHWGAVNYVLEGATQAVWSNGERGLQPDDVSPEKAASKKPFWPSGRGLPRRQYEALIRAHFATGFNQGTTGVVSFFFKLLVLGFLLFRIVETALGVSNNNFPSFLSTYFDNESLLIHVALHFFSDIRFRYILPGAAIAFSLIGILRGYYLMRRQINPLPLTHYQRWKDYMRGISHEAQKNRLTAFLQYLLPFKLWRAAWMRQPIECRMFFRRSLPEDVQLCRYAHGYIFVESRDVASNLPSNLSETHILLEHTFSLYHIEYQACAFLAMPVLQNTEVLLALLGKAKVAYVLTQDAFYYFDPTQVPQINLITQDPRKLGELKQHPKFKKHLVKANFFETYGKPSVIISEMSAFHVDIIAEITQQPLKPALQKKLLALDQKKFEALVRKHLMEKLQDDEVALDSLGKEASRDFWELMIRCNPAEAKATTAILQQRFSWWDHVFGPMIPLDYTIRMLQHIGRIMRIDGRTPPQKLLYLLSILEHAARHQYGQVQKEAISQIARCMHAFSLNEFSRLERLEFPPETLNCYLEIKIRALRVLKEVSLEKPASVRGFSFTRVLAANYFRFAFGNFTARVVTIGGIVFLAARSIDLLFLRTFITALVQEIQCPNLLPQLYHGQTQRVFSGECALAYAYVFSSPIGGTAASPPAVFIQTLPVFQLSGFDNTALIVNNGWSGAEFSSVVSALRMNGAPVRDIYIIGQDLSDPQSAALAASTVQPNATVIYVGNSGLEAQSVLPTVAFVGNLPENSQIRAAFFVRNHLGDLGSEGVEASANVTCKGPVEILGYKGNTNLGFFRVADGIGIARRVRACHPPLKVLDLTGCSIGNAGDEDTAEIVTTVLSLSQTLEQFLAPNNYMGRTGTASLSEFAAHAHEFSHLQVVDISGNNIPVNQMLTFVEGMVAAPHLRIFYFQQTTPLPPALIEQIRPLIPPGVVTDLPVATSAVAARQYVRTHFATGCTTVNLNRLLSNPSPEVLEASLDELSQVCPNAETLELSANQLGLNPFVNVMPALSRGLRKFPQIKILILNGNFFDFNGNDTDVLAEGGLPPTLQHIEMDNTYAGYNAQPVRFLRALCHTRLIYFSARGTYLNATASQVFGQVVAACDLPLETLDLSFTPLQAHPDFFNGLATGGRMLKTLNLAYTEGGSGPLGQESSEAMLAALPQFTNLDGLSLRGWQGVTAADIKQALANTQRPLVKGEILLRECYGAACSGAPSPNYVNLVGPTPATPLDPNIPLNVYFNQFFNQSHPVVTRRLLSQRASPEVTVQTLFNEFVSDTIDVGATAAHSAAYVLGPEVAAISAEMMGCDPSTAEILKNEIHRAISLMSADSPLGASADFLGYIAGRIAMRCHANPQAVMNIFMATRAATIALAQSIIHPEQALLTMAKVAASVAASAAASWVVKKTPAVVASVTRWLFWSKPSLEVDRQERMNVPSHTLV